MKVEVVGRGKHGKIAAQKVQELIFVAECQAASDRMQAVCADNKIKCPGRTVLKGDLNRLLGLPQSRDRISEHILDVTAPGVVDDLGQVTAHDLDMALRYALGHQLRRDVDWTMAFSQVGDDLGASARVPNPWQDTHPVHDLHRWPEKVHGVAASTEPQLGRALHDSGLEAEPVKPVGEHRASDTGAGDKYGALDHMRSVAANVGTH